MDTLTVVKSQWDRLSAVVATTGGAVLLVAGWFGVSGKAYVAEQVPYIVSGGLGGLFLLGVGSVLWLSADLRDEWRKLDRLEQAIRASQAAADAPGLDGPRHPATAEPVVASASMETPRLRRVAARSRG